MNNLYLKSFIRCERKAWLDFKGNKSLRVWSPHKAIEIVNQYKIFNEFTDGDLFSGVKACKRGNKGVIGLKIKENLVDKITIEIKPQLLVKVSGRSKWGNYKYIPAVYKLGHRTTREHLYDLAFCSILIETFQKSKIDKGLVISNSTNKKINIEKINLNQKLIKKTLNTFLTFNKSLQDVIPPITKDRKKCTICTWQNFCNKEAKDNGYLTDIDGVGSKTAFLLESNGISNIKELASYSKEKLGDKLSKFNYEKYEKASKFIKQAKSYIIGEPIRCYRTGDLSQILSRKNSGFFAFDIESNPDEKHNYLYGFLEIKNLFEKVEDSFYEPILNLKKNDKESGKKIINKLFSQKDWSILHYGETEKIAIIFLAKNLNFSFEEIEKLKSRFIDLHKLIRNSWILPIKNYSLKTVANWTGFAWEQKAVSGSKALYWWIQYEITKNDVFLKKIIKYNRDDCLATLHITKWIVKKEEELR